MCDAAWERQQEACRQRANHDQQQDGDARGDLQDAPRTGSSALCAPSFRPAVLASRPAEIRNGHVNLLHCTTGSVDTVEEAVHE
jgi:hypothetical protein